jgi:hypothetical protein
MVAPHSEFGILLHPLTKHAVCAPGLLLSLLKFDWRFLISCLPRQAVRAPVGGPAETGAGGVRGPLISILLNGGFGYEDYLRFCSPLAVDHRL